MTTSDTGFKLVYQFNFTSSLKKPFYSKLSLEFDVDGNYRTVEAVATSGAIGPFTATDLIVKMVKNRIQGNALLQKSKELSLLLDAVDVKGLLKFMLKNGS